MEDFSGRVGRIETLVLEIEERAEPAVQGRVRELLQTLLELHGAVLSRMMDEAYEAGGQELIDRFAEDEMVSSVLLLHDLHPLSRTARVVGALEQVKPYLASHGGSVELVEVTDGGAVVLRLEGSCHGCPSSQATLKYTIEEAILAAAPDIRDIAIDQRDPIEEDDGAFIPMESVQWDDCPFPTDGLQHSSQPSTQV